MTRPTMICCMVAVGFAAAASASDEKTPPRRLLHLTMDQIAAIEQYADHPRHAIDPATRASYSPKAARAVDDISARAVQFGIPGGILALLIAAAPL